MGKCRYCGQNAGFLRKQHGQCRDLHATGVREMTQLAAQAAGSPGFSENALRQTLRAIAARAQATEDDVSQAIAAGWAQGVQHAMSDGIITQEEENQLSAASGTSSSAGTIAWRAKQHPPWTRRPETAS